MRRSMHTFILYAKQNNISFSQMNTLMHIHRKGTGSVSGVSKHLDISKAASSQLIERLVQSGLIKRSEDPDDRRNKLIELTPKGQTMVNNAINARQNWIHELDSMMTPQEKETILSAVEIMIAKNNLLPDPYDPGCGAQSKKEKNK